MKTKEQLTKDIAINVKKFREQRGMSQEELAHKAELYRTYVGHIENGRYSPSAFVLYKLAKALKTSTDKLLGM